MTEGYAPIPERSAPEALINNSDQLFNMTDMEIMLEISRLQNVVRTSSIEALKQNLSNIGRLERTVINRRSTGDGQLLQNDVNELKVIAFARVTRHERSNSRKRSRDTYEANDSSSSAIEPEEPSTTNNVSIREKFLARVESTAKEYHMKNK